MTMEKLLAWDASVSTRLRVAENPGPLRTLAAILAHSGDSWFWILALFLVGWLGKSDWRLWAIIFGAGVFVTATLVMIVKFTVRRGRPEGDWGNIYRRTDPHSFPSGHATRAFLLATMAVFLGPTWLAIILVIWAPLVSLARVAMGVHYISDVLVGGLFGIFMGWITSSVALVLIIGNTAT